jgi:hypothetical protein
MEVITMPICVICPVCSGNFLRKPSEIKLSEKLGQRLYCSELCSYLGKRTSSKYTKDKLAINYDNSRRKRPTAERFWEKVNKNICLGDVCGCRIGLGCCWIWTAYKMKNGYGTFHYQGLAYLAHRISYALINDIEIAELPDGIEVCHACDVPPCMRHLFSGTRQDNMNDAVQKGRMHPVTRLTPDEIRQIRGLRGIKPQPVIAEQFGISYQYVSLIQRLKARTDVV